MTATPKTKRFTLLLALMATLLATITVVYVTAAPPAQASGSVAVDTSPGTAAPPATLGPYTMTPFASDSRPLFENVTDVPAPGGGTLQFDRNMEHRSIGNLWATWSHGYTGDVYTNFSAPSPTRDQVVMTLPAHTQAFYFYAEPNSQAVYDVTATASDGTTSGPVLVNGQGGAQYYGFYTTDGTTLSTITVDANPSANGFAVGEFGIAVDAKNPTVTNTTPAAGATGVARSTNLTATFSEKMDPLSITQSTFKLYKVTSSGTTQVTNVSVSLSTDGLKATLDPFGTSTTNLARGTKYKGVITTGAKDVAGNQLDQDQDPSNGLQQKAWTFKTKR